MSSGIYFNTDDSDAEGYYEVGTVLISSETIPLPAVNRTWVPSFDNVLGSCGDVTSLGGGDCVDTWAMINPGASEQCHGYDNVTGTFESYDENCDGVFDEGTFDVWGGFDAAGSPGFCVDGLSNCQGSIYCYGL